VESGALSKGEDGPLLNAALAASVGEGDVGQGSLAYTASDLVYGQLESGCEALLAVVTVMVGEETSDRGVMRHDVGDLRALIRGHSSSALASIRVQGTAGSAVEPGRLRQRSG